MTIISDRPTIAEVREAVQSADFVSLALLIPPRSDGELEWWVSSRQEFGVETFPCPRCQLPTGKSLMRLDARVLDDLRWSCAACSAKGTRFEIERLILEDVNVVNYLLTIVDYLTSAPA